MTDRVAVCCTSVQVDASRLTFKWLHLAKVSPAIIWQTHIQFVLDPTNMRGRGPSGAHKRSWVRTRSSKCTNF